MQYLKRIIQDIIRRIKARRKVTFYLKGGHAVTVRCVDWEVQKDFSGYTIKGGVDIGAFRHEDIVAVRGDY